MGLGPSLLGHTIAATDKDGLTGGRGGRGQRGAIRFFGWRSLHVNFGTHNGVPVPYSGALKHRKCGAQEVQWFNKTTTTKLELHLESPTSVSCFKC